MSKKSLVVSLIIAVMLPCAAFAAAPNTNPNNGSYYNYTNTDPFHLSASSFDLNQTTLSPQYSSYGFGDVDFFYQVRDITGETYYDASRVGGPQWFATVYENYSTVYNNNDNNRAPAPNRDNAVNTRSIYRRTLGGQIDDINVSVIGDIIDGFNFVFAEEPEPYEAWLNNIEQQGQQGGTTINTNNYDRYPDPLESLCIITTDGNANLKVGFANPYARHFPFWWNWYGNNTTTSYSWWQGMYDWTNILANYTVEPVAYIYNPTDGGIYSRNLYKTYSKIYNTVTSGDNVYITDTAGSTLYVTSGDLSGVYTVCSNDTVYYTVSGDTVFDGSGTLTYTLESAWGDDCVYVCSPRYVKESIAVQGFDDYDYNVSVSPSTEQDVYSTQYLNSNINIRTDDENYGSRLGYITFKQRASFMQGYENFREASPIPLVFVNVSRGNASDNPLIFDLTISDTDEDKVIKRMKFKWDAQENLPNQDLGTFFMMSPINDTSTKIYNIEAKITNRTGTRYMLYRYDRANPGSGTRAYTLPKYWKYDLTDDVYGTLPKMFLLDSHSQIAPGLVTVYDENLDMTSDTTASFRLYEYNYANPKDLWLNYKRVGGMIAGETLGRITPSSLLAADDEVEDNEVAVQSFSMTFADIKDNEDNTASEIQSLTGKTPVMYDVTEGSAQPYYQYIDASALNAFRIDEDLTGKTSFAGVYDIVLKSSDTNSSDVVTTYSTDDTGKMAVMPMNIRLKIPRTSQLLKDIWENLDAAEDSRSLFRLFNRYGTVRVRSSATSEQDADLFRAIGEKGAKLSVTAEDCVNAFLYEDYLYLDFMVFLTDAVSKNTNKTAFVEIFKDDDVPYVIIGDGKVDAHLDLTFYVAAPLEPVTSTAEESTTSSRTTTGSSDSGGTCNLNQPFIGIFALIMLFGLAAGVRIKK